MALAKKNHFNCLGVILRAIYSHIIFIIQLLLRGGAVPKL